MVDKEDTDRQRFSSVVIVYLFRSMMKTPMTLDSITLEKS